MFRYERGGPTRLRFNSFYFVSVFGPVLLFLFTLYLVRNARGVPDNDYWHIISSVLGPVDVLYVINFLFEKSNEHIVFGAKIFYLANYYITDGDNIGLSVFSAIFSLIIAVFLSSIVSQNMKRPAEVFLVGLLLSIFIFNPLAAHNFFLGMSGVAWIGANLFMVLAAFFFRRAAERNSNACYLGSLFFAVVSAQFYSTGLIALLAVGAQGICAIRTRVFGLVFLFIGLTYIILVFSLQTVPDHHSPRIFNPIQIFVFSITFLGGGISVSESSAIILGFLGFLLTSAFFLHALFFAKDNVKSAFWIALITYAVLVSIIAAIGRGDMGSALASRYATIPGLFWIGIFGYGYVYLQNLKFARYLITGMLAGAVVLVVINGTTRVFAQLERAEGKDLATLALSKNIRDPALMAYVTPAPGQYYEIEADLKKTGHVPFNGRNFGCPTLGEKLVISEESPTIVGNIDRVSEIEESQWLSIVGWVADKSQPTPPLIGDGLFSTYRCLAIVNGGDVAVGFGLGGTHRPDVAQALSRPRSDYGWSGYVKFTELSEEANPNSLYAAVNSSSGWTKLQQPISVEVSHENGICESNESCAENR